MLKVPRSSPTSLVATAELSVWATSQFLAPHQSVRFAWHQRYRCAFWGYCANRVLIMVRRNIVGEPPIVIGVIVRRCIVAFVK